MAQDRISWEQIQEDLPIYKEEYRKLKTRTDIAKFWVDDSQNSLNTIKNGISANEELAAELRRERNAMTEGNERRELDGQIQQLDQVSARLRVELPEWRRRLQQRTEAYEKVRSERDSVFAYLSYLEKEEKRYLRELKEAFAFLPFGGLMTSFCQ